MMHDALAVANYLLQRQKLTPHQLIKLVYLCHGWNLAVNGTALINENVDVGLYGPVVPSVYNAFKIHGSGKIERQSYGHDLDLLINISALGESGLEPVSAEFTTDERHVMDEVLRAYGHLSGIKLSMITRTKRHRLDDRIIKSIFDELKEQNERYKEAS